MQIFLLKILLTLRSYSYQYIIYNLKIIINNNMFTLCFLQFFFLAFHLPLAAKLLY